LVCKQSILVAIATKRSGLLLWGLLIAAEPPLVAGDFITIYFKPILSWLTQLGLKTPRNHKDIFYGVDPCEIYVEGVVSSHNLDGYQVTNAITRLFSYLTLQHQVTSSP